MKLKAGVEQAKIGLAATKEMREGFEAMMDFRAKMAVVFERADATEKLQITAMIHEVMAAAVQQQASENANAASSTLQ